MLIGMRENESEDYERAWFVIVKRPEDLAEALCYLKGFSEEALLSRTDVMLEIWVKRRLPQNIQQPEINIPLYAGEIS